MRVSELLCVRDLSRMGGSGSEDHDLCAMAYAPFSTRSTVCNHRFSPRFSGECGCVDAGVAAGCPAPPGHSSERDIVTNTTQQESPDPETMKSIPGLPDVWQTMISLKMLSPKILLHLCVTKMRGARQVLASIMLASRGLCLGSCLIFTDVA